MKTVRRLLSSQRGVTLIELLVVVVILGIIAAVVIPMVTSNQETSYINTNLQNQAIINEAVQRYVIDHGGTVYPTAAAGTDGTTGATITIAKLTTKNGDFGPYLQEMPDIFRKNGDRVQHADAGTGPRWYINGIGRVVIATDSESPPTTVENGVVD